MSSHIRYFLTLLQSVRLHPATPDPAHRALSIPAVNLEAGHWPRAQSSRETSALSLGPAPCVTKEGADFRELSVAIGRSETVPAEAKTVESTAVPPRADDTEKEGADKKAMGWELSTEF